MQCYASAVSAVIMCPSVHQSRQYCIKMAKYRIMQTMPYDRPGILVFYTKNVVEIITGSPKRGRRIEVG